MHTGLEAGRVCPVCTTMLSGIKSEKKGYVLSETALLARKTAEVLRRQPSVLRGDAHREMWVESRSGMIDFYCWTGAVQQAQSELLWDRVTAGHISDIGDSAEFFRLADLVLREVCNMSPGPRHGLEIMEYGGRVASVFVGHSDKPGLHACIAFNDSLAQSVEDIAVLCEKVAAFAEETGVK